MPNPKVNLFFLKNGLGIIAAGAAGTMAIIAAIPVANTSGYGVPVLLKSKADIKAELADVGNAIPLADLQVYFDEVAEGSPFYALFLVNTVTLTNIANIANPYVTNLMNFSRKAIRAVGAITYPAGSYTPTITTGLDADVLTAVPNAQAQCLAWIAQYRPLEFLIQGNGATVASALKDWTTTSNNRVHTIIATESGSTAKALIRALGRKAAYDISWNVGRILTGSLNIPSNVVINIGTTALDKMSSTDLDTIHDKGYMTYVINEDAPGWVFNDDVSCTVATDDYSKWSRNAVIGEAMRMAYARLYRSLKDTVDVDNNGRLGTAVEKNLEQDLEDYINLQIGGSISNIAVSINPDPATYAILYQNAGVNNPILNLLQSGGQLYVFISVVPKGEIDAINGYLGFSATA